jgi:hypothetical protein
MIPHAHHANHIRRRKGVSQSGMRRIEAIVRGSARAVRRKFVAVDRRGIEEGGNYDRHP